MPPYIILQYPYDTIQIALCDSGNIVALTQEHKFNAIKSTIPHINDMLTAHNLALQNVKFIGVNVGPGPYNTLRALLTMANGIHFATQIPLIGLTALDLLNSEHDQQDNLVILQAFADHVFYQFQEKGIRKQGACTINQLIEKIKQQSKSFVALGNGAQKYQDLLCKNVGSQLAFPTPIPLFNSLEILAKKSFEHFEENKFEKNYLKPIYFEDLPHN